MIRRALIFAVFLLAPALLLAGGTDRDLLLTADGTVYRIESQFATDQAPAGTTSARLLILTTQRGETIETTYVPASLTGGIHSSPALAYEGASKTLYVFWQKMPNLMSSELLFCSLKDGVWSEPTSIDNAPFHFRFNLRIGLTQVVQNTDEEGNVTLKPRLLVHAVWWDQTGYGETGRYALIAVQDGKVYDIQIHELLEYVDATNLGDPNALAADYDRDFFRHPAILEKGRGAIEVIFADWDRNRLHKVKITPITLNGVLHLPIGVYNGSIDPPGQLTREAASIMSVMQSASTSNILFYFQGEKKLQYMIYRDGRWSDLTSVALGENLSVDSGVEALRRLANSD